MPSQVESWQELSAVILLFCGLYYLRQLKKIKRERKLSMLESTIFLVGHLAFFVFIGTAFIRLARF